MKKILLLFIFLFFLIIPLIRPVSAQAIPATPTPAYEPCLGAWCPLITGINYTCAASFADWERNKSQNLWVSDPDVTALGKAGERSRQFLYWTLTHRSIDNHPVILSVWSFARNIVYFFLILIVAIFGLGIIIGQRSNFNLKIEVWPLILKIGLLLLYVTFSASIVLLVIQLSDTMMLFFIERLGVKNLFNIFFLSSQGGSVILDSETAYKTFKGCSNLNIELLDSVKTSKFMVHFTNMTYYMVGIMFILRKVVLWLLLFVSPFLALLMPFVFIRNAGWIWIGVFFQWVFYGPLFGLFLGGLAAIWGSPSHIPYNFDFSRANKIEGFVYPTTINILYGGPAQKLDLLNSSNYTDTYAEYIIALVMLWAVTIFPWWLLRIFRDYCCDGIYATKNILLSMYDQMRGGSTPFGPGPVPIPAPSGLSTGTAMQIPRDDRMRTVTKLETTEEIKRTRTEDITRSMQFSASKLTDIARFETNKQNNETITKNINFLQNPMKAETPTERQKYMNIRSELFSRAVKEDKTAKQVLSSISTSKVEQLQRREEMLKTTTQSVPVTHLVSVKVNIPTEKVQSVTSSFMQSVSNNNNMTQSISQITQTPQTKVQSVLNSFSQNMSQPVSNILQNVANQTGVTKEKVSSIIQNTTNVVRQSQLVDKIATKEQVTTQNVEKILSSISTAVTDHEKETVTTSISTQTGIPVEKVNSITKTLLSNASTDNTFVKELEKQTNLPASQVKTILNSFTQNINQPITTSVNNIASQTKVEKEKVREVINTAVNNLRQSQLVNNIAVKEQVTVERVEKILSTVATSLTREAPITQSMINSVSKSQTFVKQIEKQTNLPISQISNILNTYTQNLNQPLETSINNISTQTGVTKEKVREVIQTTLSAIPSTSTGEKETVVNMIASQSGLPVEKTTIVMKTLLSSISSDRTFIKQLEQQTNLQAGQVTKILNVFTENINQPMSTSINNISTQTGIEKEKVTRVINTAVNNLKTSKDTVRQILQKENIKEKDLQKIVNNQIPMVTEPEKHVESMISVPASVSLDEYEQVKKMWKDQYVRGEVPVSDIIKSRDQWVGQDVVFITNVLNKLVSDSPEIKQQGLDDIGYILPIFLINNLKGEQLMVYLKAKLEAAKEVEELQTKEQEIKEEVEEKKEEEFIDVDKPKAEEQEKVMEMKEEMEIKEPEEKSAESKPTRENAQNPAGEESEAKKPDENKK